MIYEFIENNSRDLMIISMILNIVIPILSIEFAKMGISEASTFGVLLTVLAGLNNAFMTKKHINGLDSDDSMDFAKARIYPPKKQ